MFHSKRNRVGANFVEYVIPVAVVGIVVGMGAYMLTDGGKLANFIVGSTNSTLDNAKKLSINAGSNPISSALAGSRKWLTQSNVFYTNDNNQTCIFFYCVNGSIGQTNTSTTSSNDVYTVISAATTAITNIVSSSAGNLSPAVLETINSVISSATQTITDITQPVGQVLEPLVSSIDPNTLISQIIPQDVLQTIAESNTQLASGNQSGDAGNMSALNDFLNNIPASTLSSASDTSTAAVETSGSAGDVNQIGDLISQVANQIDTEVASESKDPKLQEMSNLLKQIANKTVYNSGLAETQKSLENHVNSAAANGGVNYSTPNYDPYYYQYQYQYYYGSYQSAGMYQTAGLAATAIGDYVNSVTPYTNQMKTQLDEINALHQQFKNLAGTDDKYKNLVDKIDGLVGNVNTINNSLSSQATNFQVGENANSFYVNGIQYTNSQQTNKTGQNIGSST